MYSVGLDFHSLGVAYFLGAPGFELHDLLMIEFVATDLSPTCQGNGAFPMNISYLVVGLTVRDKHLLGLKGLSKDLRMGLNITISHADIKQSLTLHIGCWSDTGFTVACEIDHCKILCPRGKSSG